jgi:hypothetical protein
MDEAIAFKLSQMLCEHPLRSVRNESSKFIEAFRSMHEMIQDDCLILAFNRTCEQLYGTPMLLRSRRAGGQRHFAWLHASRLSLCGWSLA